MSDINSTPDDVVCIILLYIPFKKKDWKNVLSVSKRFLKLGRKTFDPSINHNFAIRWSAEHGRVDCVRELLKDKRVNPNVKP